MKSRIIFFLAISGLLLTTVSCDQAAEKKIDPEMVEKTAKEEDKVKNQQAFLERLNVHLNAVSAKDLETLKGTMSPYGAMQFILPGEEIMDGVDEFINYHVEWFAEDNGWTMDSTVESATIGETMGMAIVKMTYKEPERDGKPYFNRMVVSYDLEKIDGTWYVIKDHASSIEKSTDSD